MSSWNNIPPFLYNTPCEILGVGCKDVSIPANPTPGGALCKNSLCDITVAAGIVTDLKEVWGGTVGSQFPSYPNTLAVSYPKLAPSIGVSQPNLLSFPAVYAGMNPESFQNALTRNTPTVADFNNGVTFTNYKRSNIFNTITRFLVPATTNFNLDAAVFGLPDFNNFVGWTGVYYNTGSAAWFDMHKEALLQFIITGVTTFTVTNGTVAPLIIMINLQFIMADENPVGFIPWPGVNPVI